MNVSASLIMLLAFGAVAVTVFVVGQYLATQMRIQQRIASASPETQVAADVGSSLDAFVSKYFEEKRFGVDSSMRAKLRRDLVRAGFFRPDAINYYIFFRLFAAVMLPMVAYLFVEQYMANYARCCGSRCLHREASKDAASEISNRLSRHARPHGRLRRRRLKP
jgi:tight adherence protein C